MSIVFEERLSDSPYIESLTYGHTVCDGAPTRPAEIHWHMVFSKHNGNVYPLIVGPLFTSGVVTYEAGAEIIWIKFKLGVFMPHLPISHFANSETLMPAGASSRSFWLGSSTWQLPTYENVETFINRLVRDEILVHDPLVYDTLQGYTPDLSPRTVRHRFSQATGLSQNYIHQFQRAQQAAALLEQGISILDTVFEAGYYDQPHLTRSLQRFIGQTPAQISQRSQFEACHSVQDDHLAAGYDANVLKATT